MDDKKQEIKEEIVSIVVLDAGVELTEEDIKLACCYATFFPIRA